MSVQVCVRACVWRGRGGVERWRATVWILTGWSRVKPACGIQITVQLPRAVCLSRVLMRPGNGSHRFSGRVSGQRAMSQPAKQERCHSRKGRGLIRIVSVRAGDRLGGRQIGSTMESVSLCSVGEQLAQGLNELLVIERTGVPCSVEPRNRFAHRQLREAMEQKTAHEVPCRAGLHEYGVRGRDAVPPHQFCSRRGCSAQPPDRRAAAPPPPRSLQ